MKSALFWDFTQRIMAVSYLRCGTTCRFHIQGTAIEEGIDKLSRNVGKKVIFFVAQNPKKEHRSHLHCGGSLKSRISALILHSYEYKPVTYVKLYCLIWC